MHERNVKQKQNKKIKEARKVLYYNLSLYIGSYYLVEKNATHGTILKACFVKFLSCYRETHPYTSVRQTGYTSGNNCARCNYLLNSPSKPDVEGIFATNFKTQGSSPYLNIHPMLIIPTDCVCFWNRQVCSAILLSVSILKGVICEKGS